MAQEGRYDIKIGTTADNSGTESAQQKLKELTATADDLIASLKAGVGIDLGGRIVEAVSALPAAFSNAVQEGVRFNATVESAKLGIAAVLKQFDDSGKFKTFDDALKASGEALDLLKAKALESPATFEALVNGFQSVTGAATGAGIPIAKQVDLIVLMSQAFSGLGIAQEQIVQETRALITGNIDANAQAARTLGITAAQINQQKEQGTLYEFLTGKLSAFGEAGARGARTLNTAFSNFEDVLTQLKAKVTEPVFESFREGLLELNTELAKPEVVESLRAIGFEVAHLAKSGLELTQFAVRNADALATLARGTVAVGVAFAALKIKDIVVALGLKAGAIVRTTQAIGGETAALAANTEAQVANNAAKTAGAGAGLGGAVAALGGPINVAIVAAVTLNSLLDAYNAKVVAAAEASHKVGDALAAQRDTFREQIAQADSIAEKEKARQDLNVALEKTLEKMVGTSGLQRESLENQVNFLQRNLAVLDAIAGRTREAAAAGAQALTVDEQRAAKAQEIAKIEAEILELRQKTKQVAENEFGTFAVALNQAEKDRLALLEQALVNRKAEVATIGTVEGKLSVVSAAEKERLKIVKEGTEQYKNQVSKLGELISKDQEDQLTLGKRTELLKKKLEVLKYAAQEIFANEGQDVEFDHAAELATLSESLGKGKEQAQALALAMLDVEKKLREAGKASVKASDEAKKGIEAEIAALKEKLRLVEKATSKPLPTQVPKVAAPPTDASELERITEIINNEEDPAHSNYRAQQTDLADREAARLKREIEAKERSLKKPLPQPKATLPDDSRTPLPSAENGPLNQGNSGLGNSSVNDGLNRTAEDLSGAADNAEEVAVKLSEVSGQLKAANLAVLDGLTGVSKTLEPFPAELTKATDTVNKEVAGLVAATVDGFSKISAAVVALEVTLKAQINEATRLANEAVRLASIRPA